MFKPETPLRAKFDEQFVHSLKCKNCGYVRFPAPAPELLEEYYQTVFPKKSASWYNVDDDFSDWKRVPRADRILSLAEQFHFRPGIFHEVGCAFGGTVFELSLRGFVSTGSDLNEAAVEQGRVRGAEIFSTDEQHILESIHRRPTVIMVCVVETVWKFESGKMYAPYRAPVKDILEKNDMILVGEREVDEIYIHRELISERFL